MARFPRHEMIKTVTKLEALSGDLRHIMNGVVPDEELLRAAPILENWSVRPAPFPVLVGNVSGHPKLMDGEIVTSQLFLIEDRQNWARTFSRYYRLGEQARRG
ncbi:DUF6634 family protein [Devosia ginsengisoli]|uniref:DUF6634 family protein n=1 Tax=Devosia ginsengisoli TaxID=400770 RepID=UPI0026F12337|nr:DUF6634 family protein [Devosia ginsengisoli]MCR6672728.1 hypothetical protein [Devosia ginsengisoli]